MAPPNVQEPETRPSEDGSGEPFRKGSGRVEDDARTGLHVKRWSTDDVSGPERLEYYGAALTSGLALRTPMRVESPSPSEFHSRTEVLDLGSFSIVRQNGSAHRAFRSMEDVKLNTARAFSLIVSVKTPWIIIHRNDNRMEACDGILVDTELSNDMRFASEYEVSHLKLSESWLRQWLPTPENLVGQRLAAGSGWSRALTSFIAQLSPKLAGDSPLPLSLMVDHVGSLLALAANEREASAERRSAGAVDLRQAIKDLIVQRCTEADLTAVEVATALGVSTRTLHRTLARFDECFGPLLKGARSATALRMLESPLLRRLTTAEIGTRAGFSDQSHFVRTMRARYGATPTKLRGARETG